MSSVLHLFFSAARCAAALALALGVAHEQFAGFENKGLVAVGRLSGEHLTLGAGVNTLGNLQTAPALSPAQWTNAAGVGQHGALSAE